MHRTASGEITWQAQGVSGTSCAAHGATDTQKVTFGYDNLGDQRTITYGDNTGVRTFSLDNNGNKSKGSESLIYVNQRGQSH